MPLKFTSFLCALAALLGSPANAQTKALLLFDGTTGNEFVGCFNCSKYDQSSICNKYGEFGSKYNDNSIWNRYGTYGSKYQSNSPWNKYGSGLRIVDSEGGYYGMFTSGSSNPSRVPIVVAVIEFYEENDDLDALRDALCD